MEEIKYCDYGCGNKANYQYKNGIWCCSKYSTQCPALRNKNTGYYNGIQKYMKNHKHPRIGKKPWNKGLTKETDNRVMINSIGVKNWVINNPKKHVIRNMGFGFYSLPQLELQSIVESLLGYENVESEQYVKTFKTYRYIDVAWIKEKIGFEYDGYLHDFDNDQERDKELSEVGWTIYHFNKEDFDNDTLIYKIVDVIEGRKHQ